MKHYTKIITILLTAGISGLTAQEMTSKYYIKGSTILVDPMFDGILEEYLGNDLDNNFGGALEAGFYTNENLSFGFEYSFFSTDAGVSVDLTEDDLANEQWTTDIAIIDDGLAELGYGELTAGAMSFKEDYEFDKFMFTTNYIQSLNPDLRVIYTLGLGLAKVEQSFKVSAQTADDLSGGETPTSGEVALGLKDDDTSVAYKLGVALEYDFSDSASVNAGVKYFASSDLNFNYLDGALTSSDKAEALIYELGLNYKF